MDSREHALAWRVVKEQIWDDVEEAAVKIKKAAEHRYPIPLGVELHKIYKRYLMLYAEKLSWDLKRVLMVVLVRTGGIFDKESGNVYNQQGVELLNITLAMVADALEPDCNEFQGIDIVPIKTELEGIVAEVGYHAEAAYFVSVVDWFRWGKEINDGKDKQFHHSVIDVYNKIPPHVVEMSLNETRAEMRQRTKKRRRKH